MPRFREQKTRLAALCAGEDWKTALEALLVSPAAAREAVNPLLALLARPELRWQAAFGLGLAVPIMAEEAMESARVVMRRFMWSLNEESGNLGWGIPEAMGCILANSPALAGEYARIFLSYGYETGKEDNFLDHAPLRRGAFWGIGRLAQRNAAAAAPALPHLAKALDDEDRPIRGMAAWAMRQLALNAGKETPDAASWRNAAAALDRAVSAESDDGLEGRIELFDGNAIANPALKDLYESARDALTARSRE